MTAHPKRFVGRMDLTAWIVLNYPIFPVQPDDSEELVKKYNKAIDNPKLLA